MLLVRSDLYWQSYGMVYRLSLQCVDAALWGKPASVLACIMLDFNVKD